MPPNGDNQKAEVSQWIGPVKITISYHSPNVHGGGGKDRTGHIWGDLVHYGFTDEGFGPTKAAPWRAGANESTTITFSDDVQVEGKPIKAGTYALYLDVEQSGPWMWVFSTAAQGWGSYQYDPRYDALRVSVNPETAPYTEFMTFGFDERHAKAARAFLQWENKRVPFKIGVPNATELYVSRMRQELLVWPGFNYLNWQRAAQFCADNKINLEEALVWADKAIYEPFRGATVGREDFSTLRTKAAVLRAMGREQDAEAIMEKAIHIPGGPVMQVHQYGMTLLSAGKKERAMEVFKINREQHPQDKFFTYLGLARGYTAMGDKKNAIANWELALPNVPAAFRPNVPEFEKALRELKASQ